MCGKHNLERRFWRKPQNFFTFVLSFLAVIFVLLFMYDDASQMLTVDIIIFLNSPHHTHNFVCFVNHVMLLKAKLSAHINVTEAYFS